MNTETTSEIEISSESDIELDEDNPLQPAAASDEKNLLEMARIALYGQIIPNRKRSPTVKRIKKDPPIPTKRKKQKTKKAT